MTVDRYRRGQLQLRGSDSAFSKDFQAHGPEDARAPPRSRSRRKIGCAAVRQFVRHLAP